MVRGQGNARLRFYRQLHKFTQSQLADELYSLCTDEELEQRGVIDKNMISKWERGEHVPSLFWQEKLCRLFEVDALELGLLSLPEASRPSNVIVFRLQRKEYRYA